ncbi:MAG: hypothetical protein JWM35_2464 [Verrucomicrobia bacterium]|nr:hypothetical protein [Verrucomicrobiota bacterium]
MKKILIALLSLSAATFAFAGGEACKDKTKGDEKCSKECCDKDGKCTDAKDSKASDAKKDVKADTAAEKK